MKRLFALASLAVALAAPAFTAEAQLAVGGGGELYRVQAGTYGAFFAAGALPGETPVLALDIERPGEALERILVPGTEGEEIESSPALVLETATDSLFLVWESRFNQIHYRLSLGSFSAGTWSEPIEVSGNVYAAKSAPRLAVTRDAYELTAEDGSAQTRQRTVMHLAWLEEGARGQEVLYAPVVVVDGTYLGWNPVYAVADFDLSPVPGDSQAASLALAAPAIQTGTDAQNVVIGFVHPLSGRLATAEVRLLVGELGELADKARAHIIGTAAAYLPDRIAELADRVRAHIIGVGVRFHPAVLGYLADQAAAEILAAAAENPSGDASYLAGKGRAHIIGLGAKILGYGLNGGGAAEDGTILEVAAADAEVYHLLKVRVSGGWPAPETAGQPVDAFLSSDGDAALLAWQEGNSVRWRETTATGWSEIRTLALSDGFAATDAYATLAARVRDR